jgi:hypothetical protein
VKIGAALRRLFQRLQPAPGDDDDVALIMEAVSKRLANA